MPFYEPRLHILASSNDEILKAVLEIRQNGGRYGGEIERYQEGEVFNLGRSSKFIADFILRCSLLD